jgi:hypothetical protein
MDVPYWSADKAAQGYDLRVNHAWARRWILRRMIHGKRWDMGLGSLSTSLAEARQKAQRCRTIAQEGGDPNAVRHSRVAA